MYNERGSYRAISTPSQTTVGHVETPTDLSAPRRVLLTGATGFLGGAFLAHERAVDGSPIEWVLPVRGTNDAEARSRVWRRLTRFVDEVTAASILRRAQIVRADLTDAQGLTDDCLAGVTHIVHLAANTSFISKRGVWETNYTATRRLAERARSLPTLSRFVYVGTAMICGGGSSGMVQEDSYPSSDADHLVAYTASKAAAEQMLKTEYADLPLLVARPSVVIGHTTLGCAPSGSIFWVIRALERVRLLAGTPNAGLDVVPVDYVAKALDHLTFATSLKHRTYHVSAGQESRTPIRQTAQWLVDARREPLPWHDYDIIQSTELRRYRDRMIEAFGPSNARRVQLALALYLRFCELDVTFDNTRLRAEGLPKAPSLLDYLAGCMTQSAALGIVEQADDEI